MGILGGLMTLTSLGLDWTVRMSLRLDCTLRMSLGLDWTLRMSLRLDWTLRMSLRLGVMLQTTLRLGLMFRMRLRLGLMILLPKPPTPVPPDSALGTKHIVKYIIYDNAALNEIQAQDEQDDKPSERYPGR
jgi:hypothetical protein